MKLIRKLLPGLIAWLLLTTAVWAMSSANFALAWHTGLMGSGGAGQSTHYVSNLTLGQTAISLAGSPNYLVGMGYWAGVSPGYPIFLPIVIR